MVSESGARAVIYLSVMLFSMVELLHILKNGGASDINADDGEKKRSFCSSSSFNGKPYICLLRLPGWCLM